ncbi:CBM35 domain-containing protein [Ruminococcus sp.]|uniref:CBM35 domain-containing protein n=1 Tax=Ruminococcus sp. TaxID=41978 RepID=UPI002D0D6C50|nr:CBM35 domain-containing protein [Ruminococcus sp.]HOH86648.1 CBM35 domain-containing protein [Ruminococcus sp.]
MNGKLKKTLALTAAGVMAAVQCSTAGLFTSIAAGETAATSFPYVIEGEKMEGADLWTSIYQTEIPGYSGDGFFYLTASPASFEVTVPADGMYSIMVHGAQILDKGARQQAVKINGVKYTTQAAYSDKWTDYDFGMVRMNKGVNTIEFISEYGYMAIDTVTVDEAQFPDLSKADGTTVDPDATPETKALMKYLKSVYGKHILSGQQEIYGAVTVLIPLSAMMQMQTSAWTATALSTSSTRRAGIRPRAARSSPGTAQVPTDRSILTALRTATTHTMTITLR